MHPQLLRSSLYFTAILALALPASPEVIEMLARIDGAQETPPTGSAATGVGVFSVDTATGQVDFRITFSGLSAMETGAHVHGLAGPGVPAGILFPLPPGSPKCGTFMLPPFMVTSFVSGQTYVNIHSAAFPDGEIRGQISELESQPTFCHGDGSGGGGILVPCPCGNHSAPGDNEGCLHSLGTGGRLVAYGTSSISADTIVLHYLRGPSTAPVLLFQGTAQVGSGQGAPFGDGKRCVGGAVVRLGLRMPCGGQVALPEPGDASISAIGGITSPGMRHYQGWYRNATAFCAPEAFNLTNAVAIDWTP